MVQSKVLVGVSRGQFARIPDFEEYFNVLERPENSLNLNCWNRSPAAGRNYIINEAIKNECTHVLLIDDDMAFRSDSLMKLLENDKDIVSGLYLNRPYPHTPVAFDIAAEDGSAFPIYLTEKPGIHKIVAAGLGFCLIKTSIFDKLEKPYVRLGEIDPEQWCDDIGFFKRVREAGIESYCDTRIQIGHMGMMIIWPNYQDGKWFSGYDTAGSGMINTPQFDENAAYEFKDDSVGVL